MNRRKVQDWSNYTGVPTAQQINNLKAADWEGIILGTQNPAITRQQYRACYDANLPVDSLYVFVYWDGDDNRRLDEAIALANEFHLLVWLDCEWTKTGYPGVGSCPPPAQLLSLIRQYKAKLGATYAGIYTGGWWWPPYTGNSTEFSHDALWHAAYQTAEPDFNDFRAYGGWTKPLIWQYSSNGDQGVNADLNIIEYPAELIPDEPIVPLGIGVHYRDGSDAEIWNANGQDKVIDGVGLRYSNGEIVRLWPV